MKAIGYIVAVVLAIITVVVVMNVMDSSKKADKRADRVFGKLDDIYDTKKSIVQNVKVNVPRGSGQYDVVKSNVDAQTYGPHRKDAQQKVIKRDDGNVVVNVIANNQDTQTKGHKDKFDEDWDSFEQDFKQKKGQW